MLTILSDTEVRALSDIIKTIQDILASCPTVNFESPAVAVAPPVLPKKRESHRKTLASKPRQHRLLNTAQVVEIKTRIAAGERTSSISRDYEVHLTTINAIKYGKTWKHVHIQQSKPVS